MKKYNHAVVLVNYNGEKDTIECINSINQSSIRPDIIVVDNNSKSSSIEVLKKQDITLLKSDINLGFSGGNNLGIKHAINSGYEVIHLLNNDTTVDKNAFKIAYDFVSHENRISGGKIYYSKGHEYHKKDKGKGNVLWYAGGYMDWENALAKHIGVDEEDAGQYDDIKEVDFVTGCFMSIPRKVFEKVGLLDDKYFLYLEDADFTLRCINSGVSSYYNPEIIIYHKNSSSTVSGSPLVDYYLSRNRLILSAKHKKYKLLLSLIKSYLFSYSNIKKSALFDYFLGKYGKKTS